MLRLGRTLIRNALQSGNARAFVPPWWLLIAALVAGTLSLAWPAFTGAVLLNPGSDQYVAGYGYREFAATSLRSGNGFPSWNPYMFGGLPYVAAMHGDIFYPTFLLRLVMRTDRAITWAFIVHLFLAGAFTLAFLRSLGIVRWAAAFGALAYMLSGPIASSAAAGHDSALYVSTLLPLALCLLTWAIGNDSRRSWGVFAFVVGLAGLSPHPQLLQCLLLTCGGYTLWLVWQCRERHSAPPFSAQPLPQHGMTYARFASTRLLATLGMVVLGVCIGAIQLWPALGYVQSSLHGAPQPYAGAIAGSLPPEQLINTYLPQFTGMLAAYWGRGQLQLQTQYLGVVVLMLAPFAFGSGSRQALTRFWLGVATVALLWALGGFTPFYRIVSAVVPGTRFWHSPAAALYVLTFAVCVLSALGLERLLQQASSVQFMKRYAFASTIFAVAVFLLARYGALTVVAQKVGHAIALAQGHDPAGFARFIDSNSGSLAIGATRSLVVVLVVSGALLAFAFSRMNTTAFALVVLSTCGADLWSISHRYWLFSPRASALFHDDAIIRYLKAQPQPGRVFVHTKTADDRIETDPYYGTGGFGEGAGLMVHGIRSVTGVHTNTLLRYKTLVSDNATTSPAFWQHENVRWLYTNAPIADTLLTLLVGPVQNSAGSTAYLYRMPGENPYAWVAASYGGRVDAAALEEALSEDYNPRQFVAFDPRARPGGAGVPTPPAVLPPPSTVTTTVTSFSPGRATIQLSTPAPAGSALVISENYYAGWQALADGHRVPVVRSAYNLVGVALPTGAQQVTFWFQDERYFAGRLVTCGALALGLLLILLGWRYPSAAHPPRSAASRH